MARVAILSIEINFFLVRSLRRLNRYESLLLQESSWSLFGAPKAWTQLQMLQATLQVLRRHLNEVNLEVTAISHVWSRFIRYRRREAIDYLNDLFLFFACTL